MTRFTSAASPPAKTWRVPAVAPLTMPATGASTTATPRGAPSSAAIRPAAGVDVDMSIQTAPERSAWKAQLRPSMTASTCGGPGSIVIRTSTAAASPGALSATRAPRSTSGSVASPRTSNTTSSKPARATLAAIGRAHPAEADEPDDRALAARRPAGAHERSIHVVLSCVYPSSAWRLLSRPLPDCLNPPNGTVTSAASNVLTQTTPRADPARQPVGQPQVARPDGRREAEVGVVGHPDALVRAVEHEHGEDRAEDLLAGDPHLGGHAVEDRRAAGTRRRCRSRTGCPPVTTRAPSPRARSTWRITSSRCAGVDERPQQRRRVERVRGLQALGEGDEPLEERVLDPPLDDDAGARVAGLPGVVEDPPAHGAHRGVEVRHVREDELRALAAELQLDRLEVRVRARVEEPAARLDRACERELVHARMARERLADDGAAPGQDAEHAVGQAGLRGKSAEPERA